MFFTLWHTLDLKQDLEIQKESLDSYLKNNLKVTETKLVSEGLFKAKMSINSLEELKEVAYLLNDNIVIYGPDSDIIMTVKTMHELGLD